MSAPRREDIKQLAVSRLHWLPASLPWLRKLVALGALAFAGFAAYARRHELAQATQLLGRIDVAWMCLAIAFQGASMVVFARLQRWLLRAGAVNVRLSQMVEITLAANALGTSLPGGAAWSATWAFGQLRRRGADRVLAVWVLLVAGALASFALFVLVTVGAWLARSGPAAKLRPVTAALAAIPVAVGAGWYAASRSAAIRCALGRSWRAIEKAVPGAGWFGRAVASLVHRIGMVQPGPRGWVEAFGLATANWIYDALCLTSCLLALHLTVPWADMLFIYALTQIAASLPITPGGLGVVEGSLTLLLAAYGLPPAGALAGTLLYRIVSFWALVSVGWAVWFGLELVIRGGVHAGPHPWAVHAHGEHPGADTARAPDRILHAAPCAGCNQRRAGVGEGTRAGAVRDA